jgi:DNA polymerase-3 subunit gamma/tau
VLELIASIRDYQPAPAMDAIHRALDAGADPRSLARQIVDYLRGLLLIQMGNRDQVEATKEVQTTMAEHAKAFTTHNVLRMMKAFNAAATDPRGGWQPSLSLELALAEVLEAPAETRLVGQEENPARAKAGGPSVQASKPETKSAQSTEPKAKSEEPAKVDKKEAPVEKQASKVETTSRPAPSASIPEEKAEAPKKGKAVIGLAEVVKAWRDIRSIIKPKHPALDGLLNSCKPLEIRGNELILGFASDVLVKKMDQPEQIEATRRAIVEVLNVDLSVKCVVTNAKGQLPPDVNPDGMVAAAVQNGGEIVDVQD